jgi:hypothetical protein
MPNVPATPAPSVPPTPAAATPAVDPKVAPVSKAPIVAPETWDVVENGSTVKKTRKEIIEAYQLRQLSDRKRSEAEKVTAEYNKLFQTFKTDPIKFMNAAGVDFDKLSSSYIAKKAEEAMLDPKERELRDAKAEAETYKKWVEEQKTNKARLDKDAAIGIERSRIHAEIIAAIEEKKELGLPIDENLVIEIAKEMMVQSAAKKPLSAKDALPATYARTQKWLQGLASKMEGEALVKWLGQDVALKIRKYDLGQLKAKRSAAAPQPASLVKPASERTEKPVKKYKTWSEFAKDNLQNLK